MAEPATRNPVPAALEIHRGYEPGLIGRVAELHGRYYAAAWGVGPGFELMVARDLCDFVERYDPENDIVLSAHIGGVLAGSIAILGNSGQEGAQLRFFLVDPRYQGLGAGKALLNEALSWCRARRFPKVFLWTVDNLAQSRRLYDQAGFLVTAQHTDDRYTAPLESLRMELALDLED